MAASNLLMSLARPSLFVIGLAIVAMGLAKVYRSMSGGITAPLEGPMLILLGATLCAVGSPRALQVTSARGMIATGTVLMILSYASPLIYRAVVGNAASAEEGGTMFRTILSGAVGVPGLVMVLLGMFRGLFREK